MGVSGNVDKGMESSKTGHAKDMGNKQEQGAGTRSDKNRINEVKNDL